MSLTFDFTRSLKVKCHGVIGLTIYDLLLIFNSNIGPNYGPLRDVRLRNISDLEFDLHCHSSSNDMVSVDSPYMVSYLSRSLWWNLTVLLDSPYSRSCLERPPLQTQKCGLSRQVVFGDRFNCIEMYWPSTRNVWFFKTGGLSWQWSLKTGFTVYSFLLMFNSNLGPN